MHDITDFMIIVLFVDGEFHLERDLANMAYIGKTLASHAGEQPAALDVPILFTLRNKSADGR